MQGLQILVLKTGLGFARYLLLSVPPGGAEPESGRAVRGVDEGALAVPPVDPGGDQRVTEPSQQTQQSVLYVLMPRVPGSRIDQYLAIGRRITHALHDTHPNHCNL
jgi:hypothetical protein